MIARWVFHDPDGVLDDWVFPANPNKMDAPEIPENITIGIMTLHGRVTTREKPQDVQKAPEPMQWSFEGTLFTVADCDAFQAYLDSARPLQLTDHYERQYLILLQSVDAVRAATRRWPQRHTYTAHAFMLGRLS